MGTKTEVCIISEQGVDPHEILSKCARDLNEALSNGWYQMGSVQLNSTPIHNNTAYSLIYVAYVQVQKTYEVEA